ncbi:type 1 fimbrial protein [Pseudomonas putida]|uniref:fimbrial protein n=1 Tax=Pseudomonas putida TaxID=303 RepID=UPI0023639E8D|nr:fimbrial protein [Pseudomonas putida]MDD2026097.1 type 1 fimbrial protein [Pseudomonas putida]HDS1769042.1 type 1 fimbrial protein [Pseudomonas putida]
MTPPHTRRLRLLALTLCNLMPWLVATSAQANCSWGAGSATYMTFKNQKVSFSIPRDAPVGTLIGEASLYAKNDQGATLTCFYNAANPVTAKLPNSAPPFVGSLPLMGNKNVDGMVMQTNIQGVGVAIDLGYPFNGSADNTFTPDAGTGIPYTGTMTRPTSFGLPLDAIRGKASFIKIGDIDPGPQEVDVEVFHGFIHDLGKVMDYKVQATITRAQCSLAGNQVNPGLVNMGEYSIDDFKGVGTPLSSVPFQITLNNCVDSSAPGAKRADIHLMLDTSQGSVPIDPTEGVFSILPGSGSADGVGIQILRSDNTTPMPLQSEQLIKELDIGQTVLHFNARYVQTEARVTPGVAAGALNFTVHYR